MSTLQFGSVTMMRMKGWPGNSAFNPGTDKAAYERFKGQVDEFMTTKKSQHADDPNYKISAYTARNSIWNPVEMPRVVILDNVDTPDRDQFIMDVHNESERVLSIAAQQVTATDMYSYEDMASDTTTPFPQAFDWNKSQARHTLQHFKLFLDIAWTNVMRKVIEKAGDFVVVESGMPPLTPEESERLEFKGYPRAKHSEGT